MKRKYALILTSILLVLLVAGGSIAWFSGKEGATNEFKMGTVKVEVLEPEFQNLENVDIGEYDKEVSVQSLGTKNTYVRVRLIPTWSNPSLPVSNVELILADNVDVDWIDNRNEDGYFYFKYYLTKDQQTSPLLAKVEFKDLGPEYQEAEFTLKVVAEGAQVSHEAWKHIWRLDELPEGVVEEPYTTPQ